MTSRASFLGRIRDAMPDEPAPPTVTPGPIEYESGRSGLDGFTEAWFALGGTIDRVEDTSGLNVAVNRYAKGRSVAVVDHFDLGSIERTHTWPECGLESMAEVDIGVVRARAAVAETGSMVISSEDNRGRSASLLPRHAIFVVRADEILETPGDVLRHPAKRDGIDGPPSQLVFVTGPSRSADIELFLVVGVHGPAEVHTIIVG